MVRLDYIVNEMTAIKHNLQRELFKPNEERLFAVVNVTKAGKKKKASFLCVAGKWKTSPDITALTGTSSTYT